jgi:hypothetical protein
VDTIPGLKRALSGGIPTVTITKNLGFLLLAIWLILYGLLAVFGVSFNGQGIIMGILALAAGVLILINR